jgi:hypothetical protein
MKNDNPSIKIVVNPYPIPLQYGKVRDTGTAKYRTKTTAREDSAIEILIRKSNVIVNPVKRINITK